MKGGGALFYEEWYSDEKDGKSGEYSRLEAEILNSLGIIPDGTYISWDGKVKNLKDYINIDNYQEGFNMSLRDSLSQQNSDKLESILEKCKIALELRTSDQINKKKSGHRFCHSHMNFFLTILKLTKDIIEKIKIKKELKNKLIDAFINPWKDEFIDGDLCLAMNSIYIGNGKSKKKKRKSKKKIFKKSKKFKVTSICQTLE